MTTAVPPPAPAMIPMAESPSLLDPRGSSGIGGGDGCTRTGEEGGDDGEPDGRSEAGTFSILVTTTASAGVVRKSDAIKQKYGGNERSQMLKYHIQTSGRSLHAQEIDFNDIRTTLQALYAIYDNCNSLHTNAYDEAITTPTEESVRRAMAIQLIINKENGLSKNENPLQGSFIIEELTNLVEEAVYQEFERISERGGVLGAMETMYQRSKIQDESMHYEGKKASGELAIIGVNTFLGKDGSPIQVIHEVMRSTDSEKQSQIDDLKNYQKASESAAEAAINELSTAALANGNVFAGLMNASKYCSLGQMSQSLYQVGGQYRRNM